MRIRHFDPLQFLPWFSSPGAGLHTVCSGFTWHKVVLLLVNSTFKEERRNIAKFIKCLPDTFKPRDDSRKIITSPKWTHRTEMSQNHPCCLIHMWFSGNAEVTTALAPKMEARNTGAHSLSYFSWYSAMQIWLLWYYLIWRLLWQKVLPVQWRRIEFTQWGSLQWKFTHLNGKWICIYIALF